MGFIGGIIFHIFSNAIAILAAGHFVAGFIFSGNFIELLKAALVFTAINMLVKPVLKLFLGPFVILTFGLFLIVINAFTLYLLDIWIEPLKIDGYLPLLIATLIVGVVNVLVNLGAKSFFKKNS